MYDGCNRMNGEILKKKVYLTTRVVVDRTGSSTPVEAIGAAVSSCTGFRVHTVEF